MTYGCPYKGSKNKIAKEIVSVLPVGERLVDLFCGGGAIAHCAALSGKYAEVLANDLSDSVDMLEKAIRGDYANERRVITREDFHRLKDSDPYVAYCWSFGNNGEDYLWSKENETLKIPAMRLIFGDRLEERYTAYKQFVSAVQKLLRHPSNLDIGGGENVCRLQSLVSLERLQRLQRLPIKTSKQDYRNVALRKSDIVYCDIPYKNTSQYKVGDFNHEEFYEWCRRQEATIVVSEYAMPDDFVCIWDKIKMCSYSASRVTKTVEKLFIPKHQADRWEHRLSQELIQSELFVA